jgi:hypothetical protein
MKKLLLTSAVLLLASPALADKMVSNPLTPSEYQARVLTLDEKYAALRQQRENELAALEARITRIREQSKNELAVLQARIKEAKDKLREVLNKNNSLKIKAGLPPAIDSEPQEVQLFMKPGDVHVWPAPRAFTSVVVGNPSALDVKPSDGGNADLVISAQEEGGNSDIVLSDEQGNVIANIHVRVPKPAKDKTKGSDGVAAPKPTMDVPPSNKDGK